MINPPQFEDSWERKSWFSTVYNWILSRYAVVSTDSDYTVAESVFWVRVDASGGAVTVTLPLSAGRMGRQIGVIKTDSSANAVTVARSGSDAINGASSKSLASQYSRTVVIADGASAWDIIQ